MAIKRIPERLLTWWMTVWPPVLRAQIDKYKRLYIAEQTRSDRMVAVKAAMFSQAVLYETYRGARAFPVLYTVDVRMVAHDAAGDTSRGHFSATVKAPGLANEQLQAEFAQSLLEKIREMVQAMVDENPPAERLMRDEGPVP